MKGAVECAKGWQRRPLFRSCPGRGVPVAFPEEHRPRRPRILRKHMRTHIPLKRYSAYVTFCRDGGGDARNFRRDGGFFGRRVGDANCGGSAGTATVALAKTADAPSMATAVFKSAATAVSVSATSVTSSAAAAVGVGHHKKGWWRRCANIAERYGRRGRVLNICCKSSTLCIFFLACYE